MMTIKEATKKLWDEVHMEDWFQGVGHNSPVDDTITLFVTEKNWKNRNWFSCLNYFGYKFKVREIGRITIE